MKIKRRCHKNFEKGIGDWIKEHKAIFRLRFIALLYHNSYGTNFSASYQRMKLAAVLFRVFLWLFYLTKAAGTAKTPSTSNWAS